MKKFQRIELYLYFMILSGLLLWDVFAITWEAVRLILPVHIIISLILLPASVIPFMLSHRELLHRSNRPVKIWTGHIFEVLLWSFLVSGLYLFLVGNTGNLIGRVAYWMHLWLTFPLTVALLWHLGRRSCFWLRSEAPAYRAVLASSLNFSRSRWFSLKQ